MTNHRTEEDRRQSHRLPGHQHCITAARIRPGYGADIGDASTGGALLETSHRLLPGLNVEIHFECGARRICIRARVLRCAVVRLRAATIFYRGAVAFDRHLPWFGGPGGHESHA
jgi:hypothetical protein